MAEKEMCGCKISTLVKLTNVVLGLLMVLYSVLSFFSIALDIFDASPVLIISFKCYEIMFGCLLVMSFCDFTFIENHYKFLKLVTGKGIFNLFLASMFLIGNGGSVWGYLMCGAFAACGIFFTAVGCACVEGYDDSDIKREDIKAQAKGSFSGKKTTDDTAESNLLDTA